MKADSLKPTFKGINSKQLRETVFRCLTQIPPWVKENLGRSNHAPHFLERKIVQKFQRLFIGRKKIGLWTLRTFWTLENFWQNPMQFFILATLNLEIVISEICFRWSKSSPTSAFGSNRYHFASNWPNCWPIPQIWPPSLCRVLANSRGEMPGQLSSAVQKTPEVLENKDVLQHFIIQPPYSKPAHEPL